MTENRAFLIGLFAYAAIVVVIALLVGPDWMNWGGWHWVSLPWTLWIGGWFGWSIKATNERSRRFREEVQRWRDERNQRAREDVH